MGRQLLSVRESGCWVFKVKNRERTEHVACEDGIVEQLQVLDTGMLGDLLEESQFEVRTCLQLKRPELNLIIDACN